MKLHPQYLAALERLQQNQLVSQNLTLNGRGEQIVTALYSRDLMDTVRKVKTVSNGALEDFLYQSTLLIWSDSTPEEKFTIRAYTTKNDLHPSSIPAMAAMYVLAQASENGLLTVNLGEKKVRYV